MLNPVHLKDHLFESRLITNRAILLLVLGGILLTILLVRLLYLQVISHDTSPRCQKTIA